MDLRNYTEVMVAGVLESTLPYTDICQCERCRLDITAFMLNKLPPHYIVTEAGALFAKMKEIDTQHVTDIIIAMTEAVEVVKKNPRHMQTKDEK